MSTPEPVVGWVYLSLNESEESYYKHCLTPGPHGPMLARLQCNSIWYIISFFL